MHEGSLDEEQTCFWSRRFKDINVKKIKEPADIVKITIIVNQVKWYKNKKFDIISSQKVKYAP